jgi:hypothetical protein
MDNTCFMGDVLVPLTEVCHPKGRTRHKKEPWCILTVHRFTTPRLFKNVWRIWDSQEWSIRPIVRI